MNRAFLYGDGFFESIRTVQGHSYLLPFHLKRIAEAVEIYGFDLQEEQTEEWLKGLLNADTKEDQIHRISFYRAGEGQYAPINNSFETKSESKIEKRPFYLPLSLDLVGELAKAPKVEGQIGAYNFPKPIHPAFTVKSLSSIYYVLAAKYMVENRHQFLLILNQEGEIIEELRSNIICQRGDEIILPPLDNGQVIGACLRYIIANYGFQCMFETIRPEDLESFDAVYLSQGSTGIRRIL